MSNNPLSIGTAYTTEPNGLDVEEAARSFINRLLEEDAEALANTYSNEPKTSPQYYFLESSAYRNLKPEEIILLLTIYHKYKEPSKYVGNSGDTTNTKDTGSKIRAKERYELASQAKGILISHCFAFINSEVQAYAQKTGAYHLVYEMIGQSIVNITIYFDNIDPTSENFSFLGYIQKIVHSACTQTLKEDSIKLPQGLIRAYKTINDLFPEAYSPADINVEELREVLQIPEIRAKRMIERWAKVRDMFSAGLAYSRDTIINPNVPDSDSHLGDKNNSPIWNSRTQNNTGRPTEEAVIKMQDKAESTAHYKRLIKEIEEELTDAQFQVFKLRHLTDPEDLIQMLDGKVTPKALEAIRTGKTPTFEQIGMILEISRKAASNRYYTAISKLTVNFEIHKIYKKNMKSRQTK